MNGWTLGWMVDQLDRWLNSCTIEQLDGLIDWLIDGLIDKALAGKEDWLINEFRTVWWVWAG